MKKFGIVFLVLLAIIAGILFWLRSNLDGLDCYFSGGARY